MKQTPHINQEYLTGYMHSVFFNESNTMKDIFQFIERVDLVLNVKTNEITITATPIEDEDLIINTFSIADLDQNKLYSIFYEYYYDIWYLTTLFN